MKRTIKYFLIALTFCFCHLISLAQHSKIDSLLSLLKKDKEDTSKVNHLMELYRIYCKTGDYTKAAFYSDSSMQVAKLIHFGNGLGWPIGIARSYNSMGVIFFNKGNYSAALQNYLADLKILEELKDKEGMAGTYNNIGNIYIRQGDIDEALKYLLKSLKMYQESGNKKNISSAYTNIGVIYLEQQNIDKAMENFSISFKIAQELGDKRSIAISYLCFGQAYEVQKNFQKALVNILAALKIFEEIDDKSFIASTEMTIGNVYLFQKKSAEAKTHLLHALSIVKFMGDTWTTTQLYKMISECDAGSSNWRGAYENQVLYKQFNDSIFNVKSAKQTAEMSAKYESDKKEIEMNAKANAEQEKIKTVAAAESKKQRLIILFVALSLFFVLVFAGFIFRSLRVTRKQKDIIEVQKTEVEKSKHVIEEHQKEITDSITYAKRIQQSILPPLNEIAEALPHSFVLFKPKDIVAGDFYWFGESENKIFIAACDCTGHGVPGALMSMIGSEKLTDALRTSADVAQILNSVNKSVKKALRQSGKEDSTRDGMDIVLCAFDKDMRTLEYAGANRPLWVIRNNKNEIEEVKATKVAIGGLTDENQEFQKHKIELSKGDTVYLFSDGYADQFSVQDKKLMSRKLKEIFLSIQNKTMEEQKQFLDSYIENWKGNMEQTDDVLVIGVRV